MRIKFIGRGTYYQIIQRALGSHQIAQSHIAVNWGLQGDALRDYQRRYPSIMRKPTLNLNQFGNKYQCVEAVRHAQVPVPASFANSGVENMTGKSWIRKPYYSLGGRDIHRHREGDSLPNTHYIQEDLSDRRRYEVRVHAMAWVPPEQWIMQKRVHEDGETQLTWNHHTGGTFITINDTNDPLFVRIRESVVRAMRALGYQFGAVDFIVCNAGERGRPLPHYFIEWNLAPGWTLDHIRDYYVSAFRRLSNMTLDQVTQMIEGGMLDDTTRIEITPEPEPARRSVQQVVEESNISEPREEGDPTIIDEQLVAVHSDNAREAVNPTPSRRAETARATQMVAEAMPRTQHVTVSQPVFHQAEEQDDAARYAAYMADVAEAINFCHNCGRGVNQDVFGALPRFCPGCGSQVRA